MGQSTNVIVINGKRYDAHTGEIVASDKKNHPKLAPPVSSHGVMDGVSRPKKARIHHQTHSHAVHAKQNRASTLKRSAVRKPALEKHVASQPASTNHIDVGKKHVFSADLARAKRAGMQPKSGHISKFSDSGIVSGIRKNIAHLPVQHPPKQHAQTSHASATQQLTDKSRSSDHISQIANALSQAESHTLPSLKKPSLIERVALLLRVSPKVASVGMTSLAVVILAGFFIHQNIPTLSMRVAASRSGVAASLPDYKPAGFNMHGPIQYSPGQISVQFASNADKSRLFTLTQKKSNWNSDTLLENYVATERRQYQTYQGKGKTIYVYDDSNATWVDSGVWYKVEGNSSLSSDQLLKLANSL